MRSVPETRYTDNGGGGGGAGAGRRLWGPLLKLYGYLVFFGL